MHKFIDATDFMGNAFAAVIAGIVALILAGFQSWSSRKAQRTNNAAMLVQLMATPHIHDARQSAASFLRSDRSSNLDKALEAKGEETDEAAILRKGLERDVSAVIGFYELVYGLIQARAVDTRMIKASFGQRTSFFYVYLFEKYGNDRTSEWRFALDKISNLESICDETALEFFRNERRNQSLRSKSTEVSVPVPDG